MIDKFLLRMKAVLGEEHQAFYETMSAPARHALRANRQKISPRRLLSLLPFPLEALPFSEDGFLIPEGDRAGILPHHHAGMYYMQDPSAMAAVEAVEVEEGMRVLDLCAAPGGKSGQLADKIGKGGLLVSNEYVRQRALTLLGNTERLGLRNSVVMNGGPDTAASLFDRFFDLTVVDAPCSGEGMFRKYPEAKSEWSPENVTLCAERQRMILSHAAKTVAEGGQLLYSTCTFAPEENEENVLWFLKAHPDFTLIPVKEAVSAVTAPGLPLSDSVDLSLCRRFYPHKSPGEGQFIALFRRTAGGVGGLLYKDTRKAPPKKDELAIKGALADMLPTDGIGELAVLGEDILSPAAIPLPERGVIRSGVCLGSLRGKLFLPHHHLFSALGDRFYRTLDLSWDSQETAAYLRGETLSSSLARGYAALLCCGVPLGGIKVSDGVAKNHYPKGLRAK